MQKAVARMNLLFGTMSIPIRLFTAIDTTGIEVNLIHPQSKTRILQQYIDPTTGEVIAKDDCLHGVQVEGNKYATFSAGEIGGFKPPDGITIQLTHFIPKDEFESTSIILMTYHIDTQDNYVKHLNLLSIALQMTHTVGLGKMVFRGNQHPVMVEPDGGGILLHSLYYGHQVRPKISISSLHMPGAELELATKLIKKLKGDMESYLSMKDPYIVALTKAVADKIKKKRLIAVTHFKKEETPVDITETLKASLKRKRK